MMAHVVAESTWLFMLKEKGIKPLLFLDIISFRHFLTTSEPFKFYIMKKLKAFQNAVADYKSAKEIVNTISAQILEIGNLNISTSLNINERSTDKQFIFAIGLLTNQMIACSVLALPDAEYRELKAKVEVMFHLRNELKPWQDYTDELAYYKRRVYDLLSDSEKFELLDKPTRP